MPKPTIQDVFKNIEQMLNIERAYVDAISGEVPICVVGNSDFELKRLLAADLWYLIRRSGHSSKDASIILSVTSDAIDDFSSGIIETVSLNDLAGYVDALLDDWQASIPDWIQETARRTLKLVDAQVQSNSKRSEWIMAELPG